MLSDEQIHFKQYVASVLVSDDDILICTWQQFSASQNSVYVKPAGSQQSD